MSRWLLVALALLLGTPAVCPAVDRSTEESYEQIFLEGRKIGTYHLTVRPAKDDRWHSIVTTDLTLKRYGATVRMRREESTLETPEGKVESFSMKQGIPGGKQMSLSGVLDRTYAHVRIDDGRVDRHVAWPEDTLGLRAQQRLFASQKVKLGDRFTYRRYEPTYNRVLTIQAHAKAKEVIDLVGVRKSLLRVELTPEKIEGGGMVVQPPRSIVWLDDELSIVRRQQQIDGLGIVVHVRSNRDQALSVPVAGVDVGTRSLIALDRTLYKPYDSRTILYRVTIRDEENAASLICQDQHQRQENVQGSTFELRVSPPRPGSKGDATAELPHLAASHFIDHENERIVELSRRVVGKETDLWKKALRIERYVRNAVRKDNAAPLVPASEIARTLRGDCRHHAFLTAAACRAAGIPSRTAIGLLYVYHGGPKLGFHTWTEVLIDGCWFGIDSTIGKGGVSAAHVKITDHTWYDTTSLTPLLPVNRVLGKLRVSVLKVE